jgi:hypothetical protein
VFIPKADGRLRPLGVALGATGIINASLVEL